MLSQEPEESVAHWVCWLWPVPEWVIFRELPTAFHLPHSAVTQARKLGDVAVQFHVRTPSLNSQGSSQPRAASCSSPRGAAAPTSPPTPRAARHPGGRPAAVTFLWRWDVCAQEGLKKARGQRGEVLVAAAGVISPPHLRGPLSDSAVVCRCRGDRKHSSPFTSAAPFLPCPALLCCEPGTEPGALPGAAQHRWALLRKCQHVLKILSQTHRALPCWWHWSIQITQIYPNQFVPAGGKQLQTAWRAPKQPLFHHFLTVILFEAGNFSDLAPQLWGGSRGGKR